MILAREGQEVARLVRDGRFVELRVRLELIAIENGIRPFVEEDTVEFLSRSSAERDVILEEVAVAVGEVSVRIELFGDFHAFGPERHGVPAVETEHA